MPAAAALSDEEVRRINLVEVLREEAEEEGREAPEPPEAARHWSEADIRAFFARGAAPAAPPAPAPPPKHLPPPDPGAWARWFPGLRLSGTAAPPGGAPPPRVVAFHNAGSAEDMWTSEGTGPRRAPSPLLGWCRARGAELLAPQYPGRAGRLREPRAASARALAAALLPVLGPALAEARGWAVVAHSVGTWVAYEFLVAAAAAGLPPPAGALLSAMPAPDVPEAARPWRRAAGLGEAEFADECRGWDISEAVFSPAMWPVYQPLLRADFALFDEYVFRGPPPGSGAGERRGEDGGDARAAPPPFDFPIVCYWGTRDRRVPEAAVRRWAAFTSGAFEAAPVEGNHLWPLDKAAKAAWLADVAARLDALLPPAAAAR